MLAKDCCADVHTAKTHSISEAYARLKQTGGDAATSIFGGYKKANDRRTEVCCDINIQCCDALHLAVLQGNQSDRERILVAARFQIGQRVAGSIGSIVGFPLTSVPIRERWYYVSMIGKQRNIHRRERV